MGAEQEQASGAVSSIASRRLIAAVFVGVAVWVVVCSQANHMAVNPASRYAGMEALVEHRTFAIDDTSLLRLTVDKVKWEDRYYSSKPPLLIVLGAPAYAVAHHAFGLSFRDDLYPTARVMRVALGVIPWAAAMLVCLALFRRTTEDEGARTWGFVALCAGGLTTAYATHLDNHSLAFAALVGAALALAPVVEDPAKLRPAMGFVGGGLAGLGVALDLGSTPVVFTFGVAALWMLRTHRRAVALLLCGLLVAPLLQSLIQWSFAGTWRPFYLLPSAYLYPGSYWNSPIEFDALAESKLVYAFHVLVGHHGVFSVTPWLLLGGVWLARPESSVAAERVRRLGLASVAVVVGYYLARTTNYGGRCVGMRWLIVLHPILACGAVRAVGRYRLVERAPLLLGVLIGLSAASALTGAINPWEEGLVFVIFRALGLGSVDG